MSAKLFVFSGMPLQDNGGERSWPSHLVYTAGMCPPCEKAGDEIANGIFLSMGIAENARTAAGRCIVSMKENKESTNRRDV
jgi:hypothetical protein